MYVVTCICYIGVEFALVGMVYNCFSCKLFSICSFCHLTAHFAVKVYGASSAAILGYILLVFTCLIGMGVLIFSYYMYKQRPK